MPTTVLFCRDDKYHRLLSWSMHQPELTFCDICCLISFLWFLVCKQNKAPQSDAREALWGKRSNRIYDWSSQIISLILTSLHWARWHDCVVCEKLFHGEGLSNARQQQVANIIYLTANDICEECLCGVVSRVHLFSLHLIVSFDTYKQVRWIVS